MADDRDSALKRVRADRRNEDPGSKTAYLKIDGTVVSWEGDDEAPFVKFPPGYITASTGRVNGLLISNSAALELTRTVASARHVFRAQAYNSTSSTLYLGLYDSAVAPSVSALPIFAAIPVPTVQYADIVFGAELSAALTAGASLAFSSTAVTYTSPGATPGAYTLWYTTD